MREALVTARAVARSLYIYYGNRRRRRLMDALYGRFLSRGDLAFDIGAHVGDRIGAFRRLGCRVVAIEPQPTLVRTLRVLYGRDSAVTIEPLAIGREVGTIELRLNPRNPMVATASTAFVNAAAGAVGWEKQAWTRTLGVPMTTLDRLIERHGVPQFVKIDVEGFEDEVLAGLSHRLYALSFEFTTIQRDIALAALDRLARRGDYRFNAALGETMQLVHPEPLDAAAVGRWVSALPVEANSGDIYACLDSARLHGC